MGVGWVGREGGGRKKEVTEEEREEMVEDSVEEKGAVEGEEAEEERLKDEKEEVTSEGGEEEEEATEVERGFLGGRDAVLEAGVEVALLKSGSQWRTEGSGGGEGEEEDGRAEEGWGVLARGGGEVVVVEDEGVEK